MNKLYVFEEKYLKESTIDQLIQFESNSVENVSIVSGSIFYFPKIKDKDMLLKESGFQTLCLKVNDQIYSTSWDSQMVFQLASRLWKKNEKDKSVEHYKSIRIDNPEFKSKMESEEISIVYQELENIEISELEKLLNLLPEKYELICRNCTEQNQIYGIVSIHYEPLNQNEFRVKFIDECKRQGINIEFDTAKQYYHSKFKSYIEIAKINIDKKVTSIIDISLVLSYGRNNGHKSYTFYWLLSLNTGENIFLTTSAYNWRNNPRFVFNEGHKFTDFIESLVKEGRSIIDEVGEKIKSLMNVELQNPNKKLDDVLGEIKVSYATKDRIRSEFEKLIMAEKSSNWLIAKALIIYGDKAHKDTSYRMQDLIKQAHLDIIRDGLDVAIKLWKNKDGLKVMYSTEM